MVHTVTTSFAITIRRSREAERQFTILPKTVSPMGDHVNLPNIEPVSSVDVAAGRVDDKGMCQGYANLSETSVGE